MQRPFCLIQCIHRNNWCSLQSLNFKRAWHQRENHNLNWEKTLLTLRTTNSIDYTIRNSSKSYVKNIQWFLPIPFSNCQVRVSWLLGALNAMQHSVIWAPSTSSTFNYISEGFISFAGDPASVKENLFAQKILAKVPAQFIVRWPLRSLQSW